MCPLADICNMDIWDADWAAAWVAAGVIILIFGAIGILAYILTSVGIYKILKLEEHPTPAVAWIPLYRYVLLFGKASGNPAVVGWGFVGFQVFSVLLFIASLSFSNNSLTFIASLMLLMAQLMTIVAYIQTGVQLCKIFNRSSVLVVLALFLQPVFLLIIGSSREYFGAKWDGSENDDDYYDPEEALLDQELRQRMANINRMSHGGAPIPQQPPVGPVIPQQQGYYPTQQPVNAPQQPYNPFNYPQQQQPYGQQPVNAPQQPPTPQQPPAPPQTPPTRPSRPQRLV